MLDGSGNKDEHAARTKATTSSTSPKSPTSNKAAGERASTTADKVRPDKTKHGPTKPAASGSNAKERTAAHAYDDLAAAFQERADGVEAIMEKVSPTSPGRAKTLAILGTVREDRSLLDKRQRSDLTATQYLVKQGRSSSSVPSEGLNSGGEDKRSRLLTLIQFPC